MKKMESITASIRLATAATKMNEMVEQYERCYYLGAYTGQECELCPHREECKENNDEQYKVLSEQKNGYLYAVQYETSD